MREVGGSKEAISLRNVACSVVVEESVHWTMLRRLISFVGWGELENASVLVRCTKLIAFMAGLIRRNVSVRGVAVGCSRFVG